MRKFLTELFCWHALPDYAAHMAGALPWSNQVACCRFIFNAHGQVLEALPAPARYALLSKMATDMREESPALAAQRDMAAGLLLFSTPYPDTHERLEDAWAARLAAHFAPYYAQGTYKPMRNENEIEALACAVMETMSRMVADAFCTQPPALCNVIFVHEPPATRPDGSTIFSSAAYDPIGRTVRLNMHPHNGGRTVHDVIIDTAHEYTHHLSHTYFPVHAPQLGTSKALNEELQISPLFYDRLGILAYHSSMDERMAYGLSMKLSLHLRGHKDAGSELYLTYQRMVRERPAIAPLLQKQLRQRLKTKPFRVYAASALHTLRPVAHRVGQRIGVR